MAWTLSSITKLYHFTDSRNIPSIKELGGLYSTAELRRRGIRDFHPGGNEQSLDADHRFGMDRYVHLCLIREHPLQYIATRDGRIEETKWLAVDPSIMNVENVLYCPGVANRAGMSTTPIMEAVDLIDYEILFRYEGQDWKDSDIKRRRLLAKKCEVLVPTHIPLEYFRRSIPNG